MQPLSGKVVLFAAIAIAAISVGHSWYLQGKPPAVTPGSLGLPIAIDFFDTDPSVPVSLSIEISPQSLAPPPAPPGSKSHQVSPPADQSSIGTITLSFPVVIPKPPFAWAVEAEPTNHDEAYLLPEIGGGSSSHDWALAIGSIATDPPTLGTSDFPIDSFRAGPVIDASHGTVVVQMPWVQRAWSAGSLAFAVEHYDLAPPWRRTEPPARMKNGQPPPTVVEPPPPFGTVLNAGAGPYQEAVVLPNEKNRIVKVLKNATVTRFYAPISPTITEKLDTSLSDYQIVATAPQVSLQPDSASWNDTHALAPTLTGVDAKAQNERNDKTFLAGIALATGAAAVIAFIQEFKIPRKAKHEIMRSRLS
jgi:hypothetical protein